MAGNVRVTAAEYEIIAATSPSSGFALANVASCVMPELFDHVTLPPGAMVTMGGENTGPA